MTTPKPTENKHERMALLDRLERWLTRTLDSLPKSDRPDIGAGYAMAGAAAVAAVGFGLVQALLSGVGVVLLLVALSWGPPSQLLVFGVSAVFAALSWLLAAGVSLIIVVPS